MKQETLYTRIKNRMNEINDLINFMNNKAAVGKGFDTCLEDINLLLLSSMDDLSLISDEFTFSIAASLIIPVFIKLDRRNEAVELFKKVSIHFIRNELEDAYSFLR